ncbi:unnamed protein product, partial [Mesorhabditis spiculigera]
MRCEQTTVVPANSEVFVKLSKPCLSYPKDAPFILYTDGSTTAVGAALLQAEAGDQKQLKAVVAACTFCYNTSTHETTKESPFFLMHGRDPNYNISLVIEESAQISRKLSMPWTGIFRVVAIDHPHAFIVPKSTPHAQPRKISGPTTTTEELTAEDAEILQHAEAEPVQIPGYGNNDGHKETPQGSQSQEVAGHKYFLRPRK